MVLQSAFEACRKLLRLEQASECCALVVFPIFSSMGNTLNQTCWKNDIEIRFELNELSQ